MLPTIIVLVVVLGIGGGVWAYLNRTPKGIDAGISSFQRELEALAPRTVRRQPVKPDTGTGAATGDDADADAPDDEPPAPDDDGSDTSADDVAATDDPGVSADESSDEDG